MAKRKEKPTHIYRVELTDEQYNLNNSTNMSYKEDWFEKELAQDWSDYSGGPYHKKFWRGTITWELVEERVEGDKKDS